MKSNKVSSHNKLISTKSVPRNYIRLAIIKKENLKLQNKKKFSQQSTMISNSQDDTDFQSNKEPNLKDKKRL